MASAWQYHDKSLCLIQAMLKVDEIIVNDQYLDTALSLPFMFTIFTENLS